MYSYYFEIVDYLAGEYCKQESFEVTVSIPIGYPDGIFGDAITLFNWARWEENAIVMLKNLSRPDLQGPSNLWSNSQSQMIDSMAAKYKQVIRLEDLMFSQV